MEVRQMSKFEVGQKVLYSGFEFVVSRVVEWSDDLVEIRNDRGTACVDINDITPL